MKTEISSDSEKQILCNQVEWLVEKLDEIYAESIQKIKHEYCSRELVNFSNIRNHYRDLIKQNMLIKDCGNQTSFTSSTAAVDKDPNETVIVTGNRALENGEEKVGLFQAFCCTRKQKTTQHRQLAIIEKATYRRNGALKPES